MAPIPFTVKGIRDELEDTFTIELEGPEGPFEFQPGQYTMLYVFGIGEVPISISGDPARPGRLVQTIRGVGAVTRALRDVRPGDTVGVRGPFGMPWPVDRMEGRDLVFVAGGIGLASLRPAIYRVLARRDHFGQLVILYGARSPRELLFAEELQAWGARFDVNVLVSVDNADRAWFGSVGVVTKLVPRAPYEPREAAAFVCGPEIMMRFAGQELEVRGVAPERIFVSMERNMKCGVGFCGHCQFATKLVCRAGPVFPYAEVSRLLTVREV
jgi:NAD(P)H-flavin reductase